MELLAKTTKIDFISKRKIALVLSLILLITSVYSLATRSLNFGIDFTGGTKIELFYPQEVSVIEIREVLASAGTSEAVVQHFGSKQDVLIRVPLTEQASDDKVSTRIVDALNASTLGRFS